MPTACAAAPNEFMTRIDPIATWLTLMQRPANIKFFISGIHDAERNAVELV